MYYAKNREPIICDSGHFKIPGGHFFVELKSATTVFDKVNYSAQFFTASLYLHGGEGENEPTARFYNTDTSIKFVDIIFHDIAALVAYPRGLSQTAEHLLP